MDENYNSIIAENLQTLRKKGKLSLDKAANITGVSKSMIARIERGDVNPTVTLVWKLANGFKVSLMSLMHKPKADIEVITKASVKPITGDGGRFRRYPVMAYDADRRFEKHIIEIDPMGVYSPESSASGTQEILTVFKGSAAITVNNDKYKLSTGDTIHFKADSIYSYSNSGKKTCRLSVIIYYPEL